ncbi:MAG: hypothetical protein ACREKS_02420 [Candidatus Rokuibacteriota bacterium]
MPAELGSRRPLVVAIMAVSLLAYGVLALAVESRCIAGLLAAVVAWLLWRRHPRARFAAYIFLSAVGLRGVVAGHWMTFLFAVAVIAWMQTLAARRAWPRLTWRWGRRPIPAGGDGEGSDRMTRP